MSDTPEEEKTLVTIYESNNFVGYRSPMLEDGNTVDTYMRTVAVLEYVKERVLKKLGPEFQN